MSVSERSIESLTRELAGLEKAILEERKQASIDFDKKLMEKLASLGIDVSLGEDKFTPEQKKLIIAEINNRSHEKSNLEEQAERVQEAIFDNTPLPDLQAEKEQLEKDLVQLPELKEFMDMKGDHSQDVELRIAIEQKISSIEYYLRLKEIKNKTQFVKKSKVGKPYKIAVFVMVTVLAVLVSLMKLFPN